MQQFSKGWKAEGALLAFYFYFSVLIPPVLIPAAFPYDSFVETVTYFS